MSFDPNQVKDEPMDVDAQLLSLEPVHRSAPGVVSPSSYGTPIRVGVRRKLENPDEAERNQDAILNRTQGSTPAPLPVAAFVMAAGPEAKENPADRARLEQALNAQRRNIEELQPVEFYESLEAQLGNPLRSVYAHTKILLATWQLKLAQEKARCEAKEAELREGILAKEREWQAATLAKSNEHKNAIDEQKRKSDEAIKKLRGERAKLKKALDDAKSEYTKQINEAKRSNNVDADTQQQVLRNQTIEHNTAKAGWDRDKATLEAEIKALKEGKDKSTKTEQKCMEEKKKLETDLKKLKGAYVDAAKIIYDDYLNDDQRHALGASLPTTGYTVDQLLDWHTRWIEVHRRKGGAKMETSEWTLPELQKRYAYTRQTLKDLKDRYTQLQEYVRRVVEEVQRLRPPSLSELGAQDRVTRLYEIREQQTFWTKWHMAVDRFLRKEGALPLVAIDEFEVKEDEGKLPDESKGAQQWKKERAVERQMRLDLLKEKQELELRLNDYTMALATCRTLVQRVNAIWVQLKQVIPENDGIADVDELAERAALITQLKQREQAMGNSQDRELEPLFGADNVSSLTRLNETLQKLSTKVQEHKKTIEELKARLREYTQAEKDYQKQYHVCDQLRRWGAELASMFWHLITGYQLRGDDILAQLRSIDAQTAIQNQGSVLPVLFDWFARPLAENLATQEVLNALRLLIQKESERPNREAPSDWLDDFGPTAPPLGRDSALVVRGGMGEQKSSLFVYQPDTDWWDKVKYFGDHLVTGEPLVNPENDNDAEMGSGVQAVSRRMETSAQYRPLRTDALVGQPAGLPVPDQKMSRPKDGDDQKQRQQEYEEEVRAFKAAFAIPHIDPLPHVHHVVEPTAVRETRWKVYSAFALHLKWLIWFAEHAPTASNTEKWEDTTLTELRKMGDTVQTQVRKHLSAVAKQENERTVAVIQGMHNLTDLHRIEWSAFWAERQVIAARLGVPLAIAPVTKPAPMTPFGFVPSSSALPTELELDELTQLYRQTVDRLITATQAVWRDEKWGDRHPATPLEKYGDQRFTELAKVWSKHERKLEEELKKQATGLKQWQDQASRVALLASIQPGSVNPELLDSVAAKIRLFQTELKEWSKQTQRLATMLVKLNPDEAPDTKEATVELFERNYLVRAEQIFKRYTEWATEANKAFEAANANVYLAKNQGLDFVLIREPAQLGRNMGYLLERVAIKAQTMDQMGKLLHSRMMGPRAPKNASGTGGVSGGAVATLTKLSCKPRHELLRPDPIRLRVYREKTYDPQGSVLWKTPTQRVFEFLMHMAGKAACDLQDLVMAKYLEDQNGQSLHLVPIDPMELVGQSEKGDKALNPSIYLATVTELVSKANQEQAAKARALKKAIHDLVDRWNGTGFMQRTSKNWKEEKIEETDGGETDEKSTADVASTETTPIDHPERIEEDLAEILSVGAHTAIVAALEFLRTHSRHAKASLLSLVSHRRYREPFAEFCAAEYKFRQLQNLATPARDRTPHDRAVVNQQLTAAQHALLS